MDHTAGSIRAGAQAVRVGVAGFIRNALSRLCVRQRGLNPLPQQSPQPLNKRSASERSMFRAGSFFEILASMTAHVPKVA
jgi:hypothetical protein